MTFSNYELFIIIRVVKSHSINWRKCQVDLRLDCWYKCQWMMYWLAQDSLKDGNRTTTNRMISVRILLIVCKFNLIQRIRVRKHPFFLHAPTSFSSTLKWLSIKWTCCECQTESRKRYNEAFHAVILFVLWISNFLSVVLCLAFIVYYTYTQTLTNSLQPSFCESTITLWIRKAGRVMMMMRRSKQHSTFDRKIYFWTILVWWNLMCTTSSPLRLRFFAAIFKPERKRT